MTTNCSVRARSGLRASFWVAAAAALSLAPFLKTGRSIEMDVRRDATVNAIEKVLPAVVNIGTKTKRENRGYFFDWWKNTWAPYVQELQPQESAGSGVIIDEDGYVLTNAHVVEGTSEIWVNVNGDLLRADLVIGTLKTDIALLQIRGKPGQKFKAAKFAADDDLLLGETVIALGNPFGLGGSVSRGILSSKTRRPASETDQRLDVADWLQTDAAINPGNSGGPLINLRGEIIGINVAVLREGHGVGFAIPINRVVEALTEIISPENLGGLWFGAKIRAGHTPLRVASVQPESPAYRGGLRQGDIISSVSDHPPRSFIEFNRELVLAGDQRTVTLEVQRAGEMKTVKITLEQESKFFNSDLVKKKTGATLEQITTELSEKTGYRPGIGLYVADVEKNSPADTAGLQKGMVVKEIESNPSTDVVTAAKVIFGHPKGDKVRISVFVPVRRGNILLDAQLGTADLTVR